MFVRHARVFTLLTATAVLSACSSDEPTAVVEKVATVRFINATGSSLDFVADGAAASGNSNVAFGGSSSCMTVSTSDATLGARTAGSTTNLAGFTNNFVTGGNYTVIAYPNAAGATQFATLSSNGFILSDEQSGLRVFNASGAGNYDVYVTAPGAALTTAGAIGVGAGIGSSYFATGSGSQQIRLTDRGTTTVAVDAGTQTLSAGKTSILVIAPPATAPRTFLVSGC